VTYPGPWGWEGGIRWNFGSGIPYTRALGSYAYYTPRFVEGGGLDWTGDDDDHGGDRGSDGGDDHGGDENHSGHGGGEDSD
jgi:hypothetical protein